MAGGTTGGCEARGPAQLTHWGLASTEPEQRVSLGLAGLGCAGEKHRTGRLRHRSLLLPSIGLTGGQQE